MQPPRLRQTMPWCGRGLAVAVAVAGTAAVMWLVLLLPHEPQEKPPHCNHWWCLQEHTEETDADADGDVQTGNDHSPAIWAAVGAALVLILQGLYQQLRKWTNHSLDAEGQPGTGHSPATWAAVGATLVLILQGLHQQLRRLVDRSLESADTSSVSEHEKTLARHLGALLSSGHCSDVTFIVGDSQLRAHRAILVARSPVFAAMMAHDCTEATSGQIAIADIEADVLRQLLVFLYTDEVQLDPATAWKLLVAADKYQVDTLKEQCEHVISQNLSVENAAACAAVAVQHSCSSLLESAARFIAAHLKEVMATKGWAKAVCKHPEYMVEVSQLVSAVSADTR